MHHIMHIVLGAGSGTRFGGDVPKQFLPLSDVPVLVRSVRALLNATADAAVVVVLPEKDYNYWHQQMQPWLPGCIFVPGGDSRTDSVDNALYAAVSLVCPDIITVHDGARPLVSDTVVKRVIAAVEDGAAGAIPVTPVTDTIVTDTTDRYSVMDRSRLRAVQTPQAFDARLLTQAYAAGAQPGFTDDASLVQRYLDESGDSRRLICVGGDPRNIKITNSGDLAIAEALLKLSEE